MATDLASQQNLDDQKNKMVKDKDTYATMGDFGQPVLHADVTKNMNAGVGQAANAVADMGNLSQRDIVARQMAGVADKGGQLPNQTTMGQESGFLGGNQDAGMQAAIAQRQQKMFGSHVNDLQRIAEMNAPLTHSRYASEGMNALAGEEELKNQMINAQMVKNQNDQAQRNQILSSILQIGGAVTGFFAGGPAGAQVGANLGGMAGGMMSSGHNKQQALDTSELNTNRFFGGGR